MTYSKYRKNLFKDLSDAINFPDPVIKFTVEEHLKKHKKKIMIHTKESLKQMFKEDLISSYLEQQKVIEEQKEEIERLKTFLKKIAIDLDKGCEKIGDDSWVFMDLENEIEEMIEEMFETFK